MIDIVFDIPKIREELDFKPVGNAMRSTGQMVSDVFEKALTGAVLAGYDRPCEHERPSCNLQHARRA